MIAGTGSIAYGRNSKGETARAGGWGYAISDEGSGHWIGAEAGARMALRAHDRGQHSELLDDLMAGLGARDFGDFIVRLNGSPLMDFAPLFPIVLAASDNGESVATGDSLTRAGRELAEIWLGALVIDRLFAEQSLLVATHGGVLASSTIVRKYFAQELKSRYSRAACLEREIDPARGALERARREFKPAIAQSI